MRENRTYGSVRGGQSNLIPSTRLTALWAEGCGIALSGDEHEVSVTGFTFSAIWHDRHSADWLAALATPPIRLRRTSPYAGNAIKLREKRAKYVF